jgi:hypothetical protein
MATQPFCCPTVVPSSFSHLLALVGDNGTEHIPVDTSPTKGSAGLITTFLTSASLPSGLIWAENSSPPLPRHYELEPNGSFRAFIQVTKLDATNDPASPVSEVSKTFYAPYDPYGKGRFLCGEKEKLFWVNWKEIAQHEVDWCLKPPESGITVGDGYRWKLLTGSEKLWCADHHVFYELTAWVRQTS